MRAADNGAGAGVLLLETQLSEQLEVSRGTVRAAQEVLAREGLVRQVAFTRWQMSEATLRDAWVLYSLRAALEGPAAQLAAANVTPAHAKRLRATDKEQIRVVRDGRLGGVTEVDSCR